MSAPDFDAATRTELEAAAFRRLVEHLRERTDVQNIDMMNLAGFCRNCLSRWYREEAATKGHHTGRSGCAGDRLRHALQGMAGKISGRGIRRPEGRFYESESGALTSRLHGPTAGLLAPSPRAREGSDPFGQIRANQIPA